MTQNQTREIYKWLPADERFLKLFQEGKQVFIRNRLTGSFLTQNNRADTTLEEFINLQCEYLPPTLPEVKELPDRVGYWWEWEWITGTWNNRPVKIIDEKLMVMEFTMDFIFEPYNPEKGYWISADDFPHPNFNPETGEKL